MVTLNEQMVPVFVCCLVSNVKHVLSVCLNVRQFCQYYKNALWCQRKPVSFGCMENFTCKSISSHS